MLVKCPCGCGHIFEANSHRAIPLSWEAQQIVIAAPARWKRGEPVAVQLLADLAGLSYRSTRKALLEMGQRGYVATIPFGRRGVRYIGVMTMIAPVESLIRAA